MNSKAAVHVTMTSDLMCPWCWVGLRKLQEAAHRSNVDLHIDWKPFLLRPDMPEEGIQKRDPTPESRVNNHLKQAGQKVGIDFTGLTDRAPNTILFHAVMKYLQDHLNMDPGLVTTYHESVFEGYFTLGEYPDEAGLLKAAVRVKTSGGTALVQHLEEFFLDQDHVEKVRKEVTVEARSASRRGISSVPTFDFNEEVVFSGAQPVPTFQAALEQMIAA